MFWLIDRTMIHFTNLQLCIFPNVSAQRQNSQFHENLIRIKSFIKIYIVAEVKGESDQSGVSWLLLLVSLLMIKSAPASREPLNLWTSQIQHELQVGHVPAGWEQFVVEAAAEELNGGAGEPRCRTRRDRSPDSDSCCLRASVLPWSCCRWRTSTTTTRSCFCLWNALWDIRPRADKLFIRSLSQSFVLQL